MNCNDCRQLLDMRQHEGTDDARDAELNAHLKHCQDCREHARNIEEDQALIGRLRNLPVREPSPGFEARVLRTLASRPAAAVSPARMGNARLHASWGLAAAAGLVVAVLVTLHFSSPVQPGSPVEPQVFTVVAQPMQTRMVNVALNSKYELQQATLVVELTPNVMLEGYTGTRELRWQADIKAGNNHLTLPLQLQNTMPGQVTVRLEHGDYRKELTIQVTQGQSPQAAVNTTA